MAHLCIGHLSTIKRSDDPTWETHKEIARRGAFVGFDTVGHRMSASFIPERQKVDMVLNMIDEGLEDHILLSADFANTTQIKANWGNGFSTVLVQFVPKLKYFGVTDEMIPQDSRGQLAAAGSRISRSDQRAASRRKGDRHAAALVRHMHRAAGRRRASGAGAGPGAGPGHRGVADAVGRP